MFSHQCYSSHFSVLHFTAWKREAGFFRRELDCFLVHFIGLLSRIMNGPFFYHRSLLSNILLMIFFYVAGVLFPELLFDLCLT